MHHVMHHVMHYVMHYVMQQVIGVGAHPAAEIASLGARENFTESVYAIRRRHEAVARGLQGQGQGGPGLHAPGPHSHAGSHTGSRATGAASAQASEQARSADVAMVASLC